MPKMVHFWKPEACGQTVLPDRSLLIGQKLVKILKFKCDILSNFQTLWDHARGQAVPQMASPAFEKQVSPNWESTESICNSASAVHAPPSPSSRRRRRRCSSIICWHLLSRCIRWANQTSVNYESMFTVFEDHRKSLIQHCERSELRLHFEWTKVN